MPRRAELLKSSPACNFLETQAPSLPPHHHRENTTSDNMPQATEFDPEEATRRMRAMLNGEAEPMEPDLEIAAIQAAKRADEAAFYERQRQAQRPRRPALTCSTSSPASADPRTRSSVSFLVEVKNGDDRPDPSLDLDKQPPHAVRRRAIARVMDWHDRRVGKLAAELGTEWSAPISWNWDVKVGEVLRRIETQAQIPVSRAADYLIAYIARVLVPKVQADPERFGLLSFRACYRRRTADAIVGEIGRFAADQVAIADEDARRGQRPAGEFARRLGFGGERAGGGLSDHRKRAEREDRLWGLRMEAGKGGFNGERAWSCLRKEATADELSRMRMEVLEKDGRYAL